VASDVFDDVPTYDVSKYDATNQRGGRSSSSSRNVPPSPTKRKRSVIPRLCVGDFEISNVTQKYRQRQCCVITSVHLIAI